jgi:hypothetical protein
MRRVSGVVLAGALLVVPAISTPGGVFAQAAAPAAGGQQPAAGQPAAAAPQQKLTFDGDVALWSVAIKSDKTADFEQVVAKLKEALAKSDKPEAKQQAAGWKIMRGVKDPQGNVIYVHVINPVVRGADYTVMQIIYDAFPDPMERTRVYELYRGAFAANFGANVGTVVADLSKP